MVLTEEGLGHEIDVVTKVYVEELDTDVMDNGNEEILAFSQIAWELTRFQQISPRLVKLS